MKKRLLVTASTFPRWEGDTEPRFILDLSKYLGEYFDVTVMVPSYPGAKEEEILEGVKIRRYHYLPVHRWETVCYPGAIVPRIKEKKIRALQVPFLFLGLFWSILQTKKDYDLVHSHWLIPQGIVQSFFCKPYVLTGHGGDVTSLNGKIVKKLKARTIRKASSVVFVSDKLADDYRIIDPKTFESVKSKISIIPMGVDLNRFNPKYRVANYFNQDSKPVVLFVGRFAEKKGIQYLIQAMEGVSARLVLVGSGPMEDELRELAESLNVDAVFLGSKNHWELPTIYASADIFCIPSVTAKNGDTEGLPTVISEAMASGLPVIGTNNGGISSIIINGDNGYVVPEKDIGELKKAINKLIYDMEIRDKMKAQSIKQANNYSYSNLAKRYAEVLMGKEII